MTTPPSMLMDWPWIQEADFVHRNVMKLPISSGVPVRPIGEVAAIFSHRSPHSFDEMPNLGLSPFPASDFL